MSQNSVSTAVALRKDGASELVAGYRDDLAAIMPSHIKPDVFVRLAVSVLARDEKLMRAAQNNPASLMTALWDASRKGLMPGTEEYYLTVRKGEIQGVTGYQGEIEMIYRAGAVSSVIVEVVRMNDVFVWKQGIPDTHRPPRWVGPQERPYHEIDWDADPRSRGELRLVYAYGVMKDGAISKVVVLNRKHIDEARALSGSDGKDWSPWAQHEEAMWLKTGAHRLRKWVPTSAEYMREQLRAVADVNAEREAGGRAGVFVPAQAAPVEDALSADDFRVMADEAATVEELSTVLRRAQRAGHALNGDALYQHFVARRAAIEAQDAEEVVEGHAHEDEFDPQCEACRKEQAEADRRAAVA